MFDRGHCFPPFYYQDTLKLGSLFVKDTKACTSPGSIVTFLSLSDVEEKPKIS